MRSLRGLVVAFGLSAALAANAQVGNHPNLLDPNTAANADLLALPGSSR